jgi:hypothetical protein
MTKQELKAKIDKLENGIKSKATPSNLIAPLKAQKAKLEKELEDMEAAEKKAVKTKKVSKVSEKIKAAKKSVAKKTPAKAPAKEERKKDNIVRDGDRKSLPAGKRISKNGKVYYENRVNRSDKQTSRKPYLAKGGNLKFYDKENSYRLARPSGYIEKDILRKVTFNEDDFVGNFGWKTSEGKLADGYLFKLNEYDKNLVKDIKLKEGEKIYRYFNRTSAIGGMKPLIKISTDKELLYFLAESENDEIVFETKGVQAQWIALIQDKMADGGETEQGVDLFEDYENIPTNVQEVLDKYSDAFEDGDYRKLEKANNELKKIGYTFEYGLDGEAYDLRKIGQRGKMDEDEYAKGGELQTAQLLIIDPSNPLSSQVKKITGDYLNSDEYKDISVGNFNILTHKASKKVFIVYPKRIYESLPKEEKQDDINYLKNVEKIKLDTRSMAHGGYVIFEGRDNYNDKPLYKVISKDEDNDYDGEFHDNREDAEKELNELKNKNMNYAYGGNTDTLYTKLVEEHSKGGYERMGVGFDRFLKMKMESASAKGNMDMYYKLMDVEQMYENDFYAKGGYMADGGMMDEVNTELSTIRRNIMGTTSMVMKIKGMKKPQDFIVYPISADQAGKPITIQSDTRFGFLDLSSGRGLMSQSHPNGAYSYHFTADKKVPFKLSETDLQRIKEHISGTAGSSVGNMGISSDNSGASMMASGGEVPAHFGSGKNIDVFGYQTENFDICGTAVKEFESAMEIMQNGKESEKESLARCAKYVDGLFGTEKLVVETAGADDANFYDAVSDIMSASIYNYRAEMSINLFSFVPQHLKEIAVRMAKAEKGGLYALGGMTAGRWYRDKSGEEFKFIGKIDSGENKGKFLFTDGQKSVYKDLEDFEGGRPKETKLFGFFEDGGSVAEGNYEMLMSNIKAIKHHAEELEGAVNPNTEIEAWVLSKSERAETDLSDITHYLDGLKMDKGGYMADGGKVDSMKKEWSDFVKSNVGYFQINRETDDMIHLNTREHGSIGDEEYGQEDADYARYIIKKVREKYPKTKSKLYSIDEWVELELTYVEDESKKPKRVNKKKYYQDFQKYVIKNLNGQKVNGWDFYYGSSDGIMSFQKDDVQIKATPFWDNKEILPFDVFKNDGDDLIFDVVYEFEPTYNLEKDFKEYKSLVSNFISIGSGRNFEKGGYMADGGKVGKMYFKNGDIVYVFQSASDKNGKLRKGIDSKYVVGNEKEHNLQKWAKVEVIEPISDEMGWERYRGKKIDGDYDLYDRKAKNGEMIAFMQSNSSKYNTEPISMGYSEEQRFMAKGGEVDFDKVKTKYATQDVNLLQKEGGMAITDTKKGVMFGEHKQGVFTFTNRNGDKLFSGNKREAIEFVKDNYEVEGMGYGGYMASGGELRKKSYAIIYFPNDKKVKKSGYQSAYKAFSDYETEGSIKAELYKDNMLVSSYPNKADGGMMAKGGEIGFNNSNLYLNGFGMDSNGNSVVKVSFPNQRAFSIQTNGVLKETNSLYTKKIGDLSEAQIKTIEKEVVDYVKQFGSKEQKQRLKTYSGYMAEGGEFKPYGKTKGKYKIEYTEDGEKQSEVWESKEMVEDRGKRLLKLGHTNIKITELKQMAKGGIYSSDSLYILKVSKDGKEVGEERFRAKNIREAKEMGEDYEEKYKTKFGGDLSFSVKEAMASGGKVKFADKVKSVQESLLKRKKVSPKVQKDYGKTYSKAEAKESAQRIVGSRMAQLKEKMAKKKK